MPNITGRLVQACEITTDDCDICSAKTDRFSGHYVFETISGARLVMCWSCREQFFELKKVEDLNRFKGRLEDTVHQLEASEDAKI